MSSTPACPGVRLLPRRSFCSMRAPAQFTAPALRAGAGLLQRLLLPLVLSLFSGGVSSHPMSILDTMTADINNTLHSMKLGSNLANVTSPSDPPKPAYYIGAIFEVRDVELYADELQRQISTITWPGTLPTDNVTLYYRENVGTDLHHICSAVQRYNISVFFAMGSQDIINVLSIVSKYIGVPVIGYNTDKSSLSVRVSVLNRII